MRIVVNNPRSLQTRIEAWRAMSERPEKAAESCGTATTDVGCTPAGFSKLLARTALVHDWLDTWRGGENVLAELVALFPDADLFALVDFLPDEWRSRLAGKRARTSFLQHLPFARKRFRNYLPLMPTAIESLDVGAYDLVLSTSHAVAKGVRTRADQLHLCYCFTPMRYAWDLSEQYLAVSGVGSGIAGPLARGILRRLRDWDRRTSDRVDQFIAISDYVRQRIRRCYDRDATVIYPPVDVDFYNRDATLPAPAARRYYLTASRWVPYKRIDAIVAAFKALPERHLIVVGDGPEAPRVRAAAGANVEFVGEVPRERLRDLLRGARAFLFAAEEDFGILPVEAQACGTPVIAYGRGGALETVIDDGDKFTGAFFDEQTSAAIADAVTRFDARIRGVDAAACVHNAQRFANERFAHEFRTFVDRAYTAFRAGRR
jgi:glycosyltransferase involved in cell wall biosynthesis